MVDLILNYIYNDSLLAVNELKNVFTYFNEHYWLGFIFIFQILILRFMKVKVDLINYIWSLRGNHARRVPLFGKNILIQNN